MTIGSRPFSLARYIIFPSKGSSDPLTKMDSKRSLFKLAGLVKSQKIPFPVIPAKAGIQCFQAVADHLESGFHRSDDFLRIHQISCQQNSMNRQPTDI